MGEDSGNRFCGKSCPTAAGPCQGPAPWEHGREQPQTNGAGPEAGAGAAAR
ncbi:GL18122 [Drosophila persimilis]|uniref:GL18122 n=1 Tax=Drosophila persimilis TaxID=7234 RepID=B4HC24_DROPE|nr:GL18122 [Drosophila persimilis]